MKTILYGLAMCGGQSSRMGRDKSLITYYSIPQRYHVYDWMKAYCDTCFISCNKDQSKNMSADYNSLVDRDEYEKIGPMAALLTAHYHFGQASFLVVGCDYPFVTSRDIENLCKSRDNQYDAVCLFTKETGFEEPLLAIYESTCFPRMIEHFIKGDYSLRYVLQKVSTNRVPPNSQRSIMSIDTQEELGRVNTNQDK